MATIIDGELEPYFIEIDDHNYVVMKRSTIKSGKMEGEEKREPVGHCSDLHSAVKLIVKRKVNDHVIVATLEDYMAEWREMLAKIENNFKKAGYK